MRFTIPLLAIAAGVLTFYAFRMIRLATAAIAVVTLYGIVGLWSLSRQ